MRLAGTWKQYSAKAMSQLMTMTLNRGTLRYLRWPYQANVMKMLEKVRSRIVVMRIVCLNKETGCTPDAMGMGVPPVVRSCLVNEAGSQSSIINHQRSLAGRWMS